MKRTMLFVMAALLLAGGVSLRADEPVKDKATVNKGEKPKETPGWIVVEDDFWYPMRFEFVDWAQDARVHYRQREEKAAANQIMKAEWWLRFASKHALPITKKSLVAAADDLHLMHEDIGKGELITANRLDQAIARADQALAEWHFFKAKDSLGRDDERLAALNLQAAGRYLQDAAQSARYEYGADTETLFEDVDKDGNLVDEGVTIDGNRLNDNLTALQSVVSRMGAVLKKAADNK